MKREQIKLTEEELEEFDFTGGAIWHLRGETYKFVDEIRTDQMSDGPSWDTVVQRESDSKFFKWHCWDAGDHYIMSDGDDYQIKEVFQKQVIKTTYN